MGGSLTLQIQCICEIWSVLAASVHAASIIHLNRIGIHPLTQSTASLVWNVVKCENEFVFISVICMELLTRKYIKNKIYTEIQIFDFMSICSCC